MEDQVQDGGRIQGRLRIKNAAKEGTRRVDGPVFPRIGMVETAEAIQNCDHYKTPLEGKYRGRGIASGFWFNCGLKSAASATVNPDGTVSLLEGSTDIGGSRASIAMQLAETLGIAAEEVIPTVGDTDSVGYCDVTGGSRVTFATGIAAKGNLAKYIRVGTLINILQQEEAQQAFVRKVRLTGLGRELSF